MSIERFHTLRGLHAASGIPLTTLRAEVRDGRLFVAIAEKRLGHDAKAREWLDKAVAWTKAHEPKHEELARFQREAAEALGLPVEKPAVPDKTK